MGNIIYLGSAKPSSGSGGGGSGSVDWGDIGGELGNQTDLATVLGMKIANDATGTGALTILGDTGLGPYGINIGADSHNTYNGVAIGHSAVTYGGSDIAIGANTTSNLGGAIVVGYNATSFNENTVTIGNGAINGSNDVADDATESIAIGKDASNMYSNSIALGSAATTTADKQFMVGFGLDQNDTAIDYVLLDGTSGKIPNARINAMVGATSLAAGSAGLVPAPTTADVDKYLKGDGTWGTVSGGGLQNTATGTDSLTILGTPSTNDKTINIGTHSSANGDGAIALGDGQASYSGSIAIGYDPDQGIFAYGQDAIAIGTEAHANNLESIAIGPYAHANYDYSIALGSGAETSDMEFAIGFGYDQNTSTYRNYVLLDGTTGKIPNDRINGATGTFTSQDGKTVTVTNGVITSIV